jgi:serine/threonine protein kinase
MGPCLADHDLAALRDSAASPGQLAAWKEHVAGCASCASRLEEERAASDEPFADEEGRAEELRPGTRLGDFAIEKRLGAGGMGVVYRARQLSLNRPVALKVLRPGLALTPKAEARFQREARAAAKLHHTNIVAVYAEGEDRGVCYYAMELIDGPSLNRVITGLRRQQDPPPAGGETADYVPTPPPDGTPASTTSLSGSGTDAAYFDTVARWMADAAAALDYAHQQQVIHRDIKPSNLMLDANGRLTIMDFGLARLLEEPGVTVSGEFLGTPRYMSPEQVAAGRTRIDHRTDIYSLGATLYELLALRPVVTGQTREQVLTQILTREPVPPRRLNRKVPVDLETICLKALEKDPERRYPTAAALADDLRRYLNRFAITAKRVGPVARLVKLTRRHKLATVACGVIFLLAAVAGVTTWLYHRSQQEIAQREAETREEREKADLARRQREAIQKVRDVERLIKEQKFRQAFALLENEVAPYLLDDPRLEELRSECSWILSIVTDPASVAVSMKPVDDDDGEWTPLGQTPIDNLRVARGCYHWKLEKPGYETAEGFGLEHPLGRGRIGGVRLQVQLDPQGTQPEGMVRVPRASLPQVSGLLNRNIPLGPFHLDRYEVTNRQFKEFVDQGGYQKSLFWEHAFVKEGKPLSWEEAMTKLRDSTGRPGPATWEFGNYPNGQADYPVAGVSWYEAAAYAKFAGKNLPTIYHWLTASGLGLAGEIVPRSNFGRAGPAKVGQYQGLGPFGTYDMAGNVKEWCFNSAEDSKRYLLGGAWNEEQYMFSILDVQSPFHRGRNCGFRCMKYLPGQEPPAEALQEAKRPWRDFLKEKLLTDAEFKFVKDAYTYDKERALNSQVVQAGGNDYWVCERVEYDAAYGKERAVLYLFLPRHVRPPYQPVIYWPGGYARDANVMSPLENERVAFLVRSGRALIWPIYKGTYERRGSQVRWAAEEWELERQRANDLRRAIDYLESRPDDLDASAIGYYGVSWGASRAIRVLAVEDRVKAAVFANGGLWIDVFPRPELDPLHYVPRIKIPVLMLNGEFDAIFPLVESQKPMFQLLGTPDKHKKHLLFKDSHSTLILPERMQETVNWFDRYLGPVTPKSSPAGSSK